jgi:hypothetical protein
MLAATAVVLLVAQPAAADEGEVSFWLPGQFGSFAAVPGEPGWSLPIDYHTSADASANRSFQRGGSGAVLGDFKSRVSAVGPQIGYFFPVESQKWYANLKGYYEFDAQNRLEG